MNFAPIDPQTVIAVVAIINALAAAIALIVSTWFAARRAGRSPIDPRDDRPVSNGS